MTIHVLTLGRQPHVTHSQSHFSWLSQTSGMAQHGSKETSHQHHPWVGDASYKHKPKAHPKQILASISQNKASDVNTSFLQAHKLDTVQAPKPYWCICLAGAMSQ